MPVNPVKFELRRDTYANWTGVGNVLVLSAGEPSVVLDGIYASQMKIGDGVNVWNNLPFVGVGGGGGGSGFTGPTGPMMISPTMTLAKVTADTPTIATGVPLLIPYLTPDTTNTSPTGIPNFELSTGVSPQPSADVFYNSGSTTLPLLANWYVNVSVPGAATLTTYAVMTLPSAATYMQGETAIQYAIGTAYIASSAVFLLPPGG